MNIRRSASGVAGLRLGRRMLPWLLSVGAGAVLLAAYLPASLKHLPREQCGSRQGCATSCKHGGTAARVRDAEEEGWSRHRGDGLPARPPEPWFFDQRAYPVGRIPLEEWHQAQFAASALKAQQPQGSGTWDFRGPTNIGGRITDIVVDPTNSAVAFAGVAEGGVLRTTDSGQNWTPLFDSQNALSIGALCLDPANPQIVYAGTGEVNPGGGSVAYGGDGILRSTDQGNSWTPLGLETTGSIGRIRIDPTNSQRIYVAAMGDLFSKGSNRGVYRSTDAGATWQNILFLSDSTGAVDLIQRPDQPATLFAAMWERMRHPSSYRYGGITSGVYMTTNGGNTWTLVGGGLPAPSTNVGRIGLSLCASQPNTMYAVYADQTGYFAGLYKSTNGGSNWTRTNDGALANAFASYGWWFGNVRVAPTDPNRVFVVGFDDYRSTNGGSSWSDVSASMHVDHHALDFGPGTNPVIYEGNDGGLYRSTNGGTAWSMLPNQPITQFYRVGLDLQTPTRLYGGAQDNGTPRTLTGALNDWVDIYGGDGFQPLVYPTNSNRIWAESQYGALGYSSNGGNSFGDATGGISGSDRFNWNTAVRFDASNPARMFFGTQRVYLSTNGTTWTPISPDLTGGGGGNPNYGTVTTVESSPVDGQVIWAGTDDGHVQVTTNGGTSWTNVSAGLPNRWVTSVRPHPSQRAACYVTVSGFRWGSPTPHISLTTDMGASWTSVEGNLPQAPCNDLIIDPTNTQRLWAATDVGVYETLDGGTTWSVLGSNLPNVVVTMLAFDPGGRKLTAATYGRSFFSYNVDQPTSVAPAPAALAGAEVLPPAPNPMRRGAWIRWRNAPAGRVRAEVFAVSGRKIWSGEASSNADGSGQIWWNRTESTGRSVPAGSYYCRLQCGRREWGGRTVVVLP